MKIIRKEHLEFRFSRDSYGVLVLDEIDAPLVRVVVRVGCRVSSEEAAYQLADAFDEIADGFSKHIPADDEPF